MSFRSLSLPILAAALIFAGCKTASAPEPAPAPAPAPAAKAAPAKKGAPAKAAPAKPAAKTAPAPAPAAASNVPMDEGDTPPPAGHKFSKITGEMYEPDVKKIMGEPTNAREYPTAKAFIPYASMGAGATRVEQYYKGSGRIVFDRNSYTRSLRVVRVIYDPKDTGF